MTAHCIADSFKTLGCCLILAALFAPSAQAAIAEIDADPGTVGGAPSDGFVFSLDAEFEVVDIAFSDGKRLEFPLLDPAQLTFTIQETSGTTGGFPIAGFLIDENGSLIDGTGFVGSVDLGVTNAPTNDVFPEGTIWSGMLFVGDFLPGDYTLAWLNENPTVLPEPGSFALLSVSLLCIGACGANRKRTCLRQGLGSPRDASDHSVCSRPGAPRELS